MRHCRILGVAVHPNDVLQPDTILSTESKDKIVIVSSPWAATEAERHFPRCSKLTEYFPGNGFPNIAHTAFTAAARLSRIISKNTNGLNDDFQPARYFFANLIASQLTTIELMRRAVREFRPELIVLPSIPAMPVTYNRMFFHWSGIPAAAVTVADEFSIPTLIFPGRYPRSKDPTFFSKTRENIRWWRYRLKEEASFRRLFKKNRRLSDENNILFTSSVGRLIEYLEPAAKTLIENEWQVIFTQYIQAGSAESLFPVISHPMDLPLLSFPLAAGPAPHPNTIADFRATLTEYGLLHVDDDFIQWCLRRLVNYCIWLQKFTATVLNRLRPRLLVVTCEPDNFEQALVVEAKRRGIQTLSLQHGPRVDTWAYLSVADHIAVWSHRDAAMLQKMLRVPNNSISVVGNDCPATDDSSGHTSEEIRILVLLDILGNFTQSFSTSALHCQFHSIIRSAVNFSGVQFIIRRHPGIPDGFGSDIESPPNVIFDRQARTYREWGPYIEGFDAVLGDICDPYIWAKSLRIPRGFIANGWAEDYVRAEAESNAAIIHSDKDLHQFVANIKKRSSSVMPRVLGSDCSARNTLSSLIMSKLSSTNVFHSTVRIPEDVIAPKDSWCY